jgi:sugar O-acyltransferase (sialic acid O-acetyltransferase NeuD family)
MRKKMKLGIYGSSGLGREIYEIASRRNSISPKWSRIDFVDDFRGEGEYFGTTVINFSTLVKLKDEYECLIAVGEPSVREILYSKLLNSGVKLTSLIDPSAIVSPSSKVQNGTIILECATIHSGVTIGTNTLIQPFCLIGHDIQIGNHTVLSAYCVPGGGAIIGNRVFVGLHCAIKEGLVIGDDAIVAMGSVVFRDIPPASTVVGNPARITKGNAESRVFTST